MKHRRRSPATVLLVALAGGALAGLLVMVYEVMYLDYRGGIIPFWVGATAVVLVSVVVAFLSVGSALVVFVGLARFLPGRALLVVFCAMLAAIIGGGAGTLLGNGPESWIYPLIWALAPALYVALTFPRLRASWRKT